jgi:guanylate kinase
MTRSLLVFIGPSGSGKSSVVRSLVDRRVICVHPTWTTRPRRPDESAGSVEHRFVSEPDFLRLRDDKFFLHSVQLFGMPYWYGLPIIERNENGAVDAVMLRAPLVPILREFYKDPVIYQVEATSAVVEARLAARGYTAGELDARLSDNEKERVAGRSIAQRHFDNDEALDPAVNEVERAVREDFAPRLMEAR